ncbi:tetratricopeptide repeat-containing sulfotransferase family protein [Qipengyuania qiaonensis]|uniref:Sulfotransferase n=1 Tax=Qipengyuania qiaonensis TaxID=2867240 RepID=A0ABS7JAZ7_9SPHN|nr:tetratricopeptide repeat-containing sulfotransferase family protein [Qipengyuania qiaonensis]MBX7483229.1 sulfotransferase [Qipengyuania qiaonensis]
MAAMTKLRQGDNEGALALIENNAEPLGEEAPWHAIAAMAAQRMEDHSRAIPHLERILTINPRDVATKVNLANAFVSVENHQAALSLARDESDPRLIRVEAFVLQAEGRLAEAAEAYRRCVAADMNDLAAFNNLGNVLAKLGDFDGAITAFERAITLAPADIPIYLNLAEVLREADRREALIKTLSDARAIAPDDVSVLTELGMAYTRVEDFDSAIATLRQAIKLSPHFGPAHIELGLVYESLNRLDDLAELVDSIDIDAAPAEAEFLKAWKARREGRFEDAARHAAAIPETVHSVARFHLIGGIEDRLGNAPAAFAAFEQMNAGSVAGSRAPEGASFREKVGSELERWTADWAQNLPTDRAVEDGLQDPVFLVGFPRSGTTLLDTMLMGIDDLCVLEERPMMASTLKRIGDHDLGDLDMSTIGNLRREYFKEACHFGMADGKWLVDKHPLNMTRVPTIHWLFPNARIILAERHPYDVVLSTFMANFNLNHAMRSFTELEEAARTYDAAFSSWKRATELFAVDWRAVRYERLVENPRTELEPLIEWLGLEWDDRLLDHTETARQRGRVRTASYSQIGEQLYTRAAGRWRRYADQLSPVIPILRPWAEKMNYETE